jgi:hypothetical protein
VKLFWNWNWNEAAAWRVAASLALALALGRTQPALAVFVPTRYEARQVTTPPTIDGDLTDSVWSHAQRIHPFYAYQSGGDPPAAESSARVLWDQNHLYLGFEMKDVEIRSSCGWHLWRRCQLVSRRCD